MRAQLRDAVVDLIERLAATADRAVAATPATLRAEIRAALAPCPEVEHRVVATWDAHRARHDATVIVLDDELGGALTLEVRGTRDELPLTLLATQRWSERDVVRVDGHTLAVDDVIAALDFLWSDVRIATRLIDMLLLRDELERAPIDLSDQALQDGVDGFRARNGLCTVDETTAWLHERGLSLADLEELVARELELAAAARRRVAADVDTYFAAHRDDFDAIQLAHVSAPDRDGAAAAARALLAGQLPAGATELHVTTLAAHTLDAADRALAVRTPSSPAPLRDGRWQATVILARHPAALTPATRAEVETRLTTVSLAAARTRAVIEWNWGTRRATDALTAAVRAG